MTEIKIPTALKPRPQALLIRFSSMGDVAHCMPLAQSLNEAGMDVHFLTKKEWAPILEFESSVAKVWAYKKSEGLWPLLQILKQQNFSYVVDAHNSLRSRLVRWFLISTTGLALEQKTFVKPKARLTQWLELRLAWPKRRGAISAAMLSLELLHNWDPHLPTKLPTGAPSVSAPLLESARSKLKFQNAIFVAPVANYELKRWPLENFRQLIEQFPSENFVVLGGPDDLELKALEKTNVQVLAGECSIAESLALISEAKLVVGNDTGLTHWADFWGRPTILLLGPTAYGRTYRKTSHVIEMPLPCRPCTSFGNDSCLIAETQACMKRISVEQVAQSLKALLKSKIGPEDKPVIKPDTGDPL